MSHITLKRLRSKSIIYVCKFYNPQNMIINILFLFPASICYIIKLFRLVTYCLFIYIQSCKSFHYYIEYYTNYRVVFNGTYILCKIRLHEFTLGLLVLHLERMSGKLYREFTTTVVILYKGFGFVNGKNFPILFKRLLFAK